MSAPPIGNTDSKAKRQPGIEVLRMLAMYLIVLGHYLYNYVKTGEALSTFDVAQPAQAISYALTETMIVFTSTGVDLFVLITGFFLVSRPVFRIKGMLSVALTTIFYAVGVFVLFCLTGRHGFALKELLLNLSPIPVHQYWFVAKYLGLMLVAPFLSLLALQLSRKGYQLLLLVLFVLFFEWPFGELFGGGMSLNWFCFLFLVGGYLSRHGIPSWLSAHTGWGIVAVAAAIFALHTATNLLAWQKTGAPFVLKYDGNHSFTFFLALFIFVLFVRNPLQGRTVEGLARLAPYTFGVYLLHEHYLLKDVLWQHIAPAFLPTLPLFLHGILLSLLVFCAALFIDSLRAFLFRVLHIPALLETLSRRINARIPPLETRT